jgi:hypothetical protein
MIKIGMTIAALAVGAASLTGCDTTSQTAVTSAICADAVTLQGSSLALNKTQTTALQGIVTACASTAGGTTFNNATVALAIIQDAILLQSSGLLKDVHITAQAPDAQLVLRKIKAEWLAKVH